MNLMNTTTITVEDFEELRESGKARADQAYAVVELGWHGAPVSGRFAWSPDGEGFFFYDTYQELLDNHGLEV